MNWSRIKHVRLAVREDKIVSAWTTFKLHFAKYSSFSSLSSRKYPNSWSSELTCISIQRSITVSRQHCVKTHHCWSNRDRVVKTSVGKQDRRLHTNTGRVSSPWRVLFFGTDQFSVKVLQILNENRNSGNQNLIEKLDVLCNVGETKIRQYASSTGLTVLDWPAVDLTAGQYDVGILASFGHLIPARVISKFPQGILNIHPSLLPRWRGASPIVHTILSRDRLTGVSIMKLRPKHFDTGPLLSKKEVTVPENVTAFQLQDILAEEGGRLAVQVLKSLPHVEEEEQPSEGVTYAHKVIPSMTYIHWQSESCDDIYCHYRASGEFLPLRSELDGRPIKLLGFRQVDREDGSALPGTVVFDRKLQFLCVKCVDGWVGFEKIIIKKTMTAQAFYNGYLSKMADRKLVLSSVSNGLDTETYSKRILQRR